MQKAYKQEQIETKDEDGIADYVLHYCMQRRKWFKAAEVLVEIVTRANEEDLSSFKERNTFRH